MQMIIVAGSECSGTKLLQRILLATTGFKGDDATTERWWLGEPLDVKQGCDRVTRRSVPHGPIHLRRDFPNVVGFGRSARAAGYDVRFVLTVRDRICSTLSKARNHTFNEWDACRDMEIAATILGDVLSCELQAVVCSYEALMMFRQDYANHILRQLGIKANAVVPKLIDANVKYMKKDPWKTKTLGEQVEAKR